MVETLRSGKYKQCVMDKIPTLVVIVFALSLGITAPAEAGGTSDESFTCVAADDDNAERFICRALYFTGQLMWERTYLQNDLHGPSKEFYPNGQVMWEGTYVENELHGLIREYYRSGALKTEAHYESDELQGEDKEYYESGPVKFHGRYRDDEIDGPFHIYYEDGTRAYEWQFDKGYLLDKDGNRFNGRQTSHHANGKLWEEFHCKNGVIEGPLKLYYQDGTLKQLETNRNGELHGEAIEYYPNGRVEVRDVYEDGEIVSQEMYDPEGILIWKEGFE